MIAEELSYNDAPVAVRKDLTEAHRRAWVRIGQPGTWWTGEERVAIAAETRNALECSLCKRRKESLSPFAVEGEHQTLGDLPSPLVEVIHRIVTDPGRLTKRWFDQVLASGLSDASYVEAVCVVVTVVNIDTFGRAIGAPAVELPDPVDGSPSRARPAVAKEDGAWVPMIAVDDATGPYEDLYKGSIAPNIQRAMSLVPDAVRNFTDLIVAQYVPPHLLLVPTSDKAITRPQMELLAARVSALNECFY